MGQIKYQKIFPSIIYARERTDDAPNVVPIYYMRELPLIARICYRTIKKLTGVDFYWNRKIAVNGKKVFVHSHFGPTGWSDLRSQKNWHVTRFYGYDLHQLPRMDERWVDRYHKLFEQCDGFLVEGPYMKKTLNELGCPIEKIFVHTLATSVDGIPFAIRSNCDPFKILIVSRFTEKKGVPYALEAAAIAHHEFGIPIKVTVIGDADNSTSEQVEKEKILSMIKKYKMWERVQLLGFKDYDEVLQMALENHVFLHPSVTAADGDCEGGAPVVLMDMLATGIPVVSTLHCDIPNIITDRRLGYLSPERDSMSLANNIVKIRNRYEYFDNSFIRGFAAENFNWNNAGANLASIYNRVISL